MVRYLFWNMDDIFNCYKRRVTASSWRSFVGNWLSVIFMTSLRRSSMRWRQVQCHKNQVCTTLDPYPWALPYNCQKLSLLLQIFSTWECTNHFILNSYFLQNQLIHKAVIHLIGSHSYSYLLKCTVLTAIHFPTPMQTSPSGIIHYWLSTPRKVKFEFCTVSELKKW